MQIDVIHQVCFDDCNLVVDVAVRRKSNRLRLAFILQHPNLSNAASAALVQARFYVRLDVDAVDGQPAHKDQLISTYSIGDGQGERKTQDRDFAHN